MENDIAIEESEQVREGEKTEEAGITEETGIKDDVGNIIHPEREDITKNYKQF